MRPEPFKKWTRPFRLRRRLRAYLPTSEHANYRLANVGRPGTRDVVEFRREGLELTLLLADGKGMENDWLYYIYRLVLPAVLNVFSRTDPSIRSAVAELNDGTDFKSDHLVFCSTEADPADSGPRFLEPERLRRASRHHPEARPWAERDSAIVWRGSSTGRGNFSGPISTRSLRD